MIGTLEALLVETLARGVSTGRARVDQERAAAEVQIRFEQFFTPGAVAAIGRERRPLDPSRHGGDGAVCDIRQLQRDQRSSCGAELTMEWLSEVMGKMADCAAAYDGALVDYIGDELMVMWARRAQQPDHATRACQTALEHGPPNEKLDEKWRTGLGHATQLGFGINTGNARVGNVGFERKFRYAPFGNTVNTRQPRAGSDEVPRRRRGRHRGRRSSNCVASRSSRRLCSVRVVNIEEPVMLYELCPTESPEIQQLCEQYEEALGFFEKRGAAPRD